MGLIDTFLMNSNSIEKGYKRIFKGINYLIAKEKDNIVWFTYDIESADKIIKKFLKENNLNEKVIFERKTYKNKNIDFINMIDKKIVLLNGKLVLYEEIKKLATENKIKNYKDRFPKYGINKFESYN